MPTNQLPLGLRLFSSSSTQIKAFLPYRSLSEHNVQRLIVEGLQALSFTTLPAARPGESIRCSWLGLRHSLQPAQPADAWGSVLPSGCTCWLDTICQPKWSNPHPALASGGQLNLLPTERCTKRHLTHKGTPHTKGSLAQLGLRGT